MKGLLLIRWDEDHSCYDGMHTADSVYWCIDFDIAALKPHSPGVGAQVP